MLALPSHQAAPISPGLAARGSVEAAARAVLVAALVVLLTGTASAGEELSASAQFNLGNEYARRGQVGRAVLAYERALAINPRDADARANLEQVRKDAGLFREPPATWRRPLELLGTNEWAVTGLLSLVALAGLAFCRKRFPGRRAAVVALSLLVLVSGTGAVAQANALDRAVVVTDDARLLVSPYGAADSMGEVAAGRSVRIRREFEDFVEVRDEAGRRGWLPRYAVVEITHAED